MSKFEDSPENSSIFHWPRETGEHDSRRISRMSALALILPRPLVFQNKSEHFRTRSGLYGMPRRMVDLAAVRGAAAGIHPEKPTRKEDQNDSNHYARGYGKRNALLAILAGTPAAITSPRCGRPSRSAC